ncbi:MAG: hypothetical protein QOH25_2603 [Acidobacteriota bacterium]|jgi:tetratricopeptide (TPR) repeat protein|nr:hypothetical protein [Acidobacteriota bacterium]
MFYRPKLLPFLFVLLSLLTSINAQVLDYQTRSQMEREITRVLLEKDVGEVANQLAREPAESRVVPQLRRLGIFARAGHRARVLQTLNQLAEASDLPPVAERWSVAEAVKEIIGQDDLAALRMYYERIMPVDAAGAENILRLWEREGDAKELDAWLAARVAQHPGWLQWRIYWRVKLGTVNELLNALAADVKAHAEDMERVFRYLQANASAGHPQKVAWLAGIFETWLTNTSTPRVAFELYEMGTRLQTELPEVAAKLFEHSLQLSFTERDMQLIRERVIIRFQITPRVKNWEKQLRFWTKQQLAETYQAMKQPQAAQPIIEELVRMKDDDDIMAVDVHQLAGAVQAQTGMRVVEAKILREEATEKESAAYWLERARYYKGRKEYDAVMDAYRQAFVHVPIRMQDKRTPNSRLALLMDFALFVASRDMGDDEKRKAWRGEIKEALRREFTATPPETEYAFGVAQIITDNEFELDDLRDSLFAGEKDLLSRMLAARHAWANEEGWLIAQVVCRESVSPERKASHWTQLEELTKSGSPSRAFRLAEVMLSCNESRRAVPLLIGYLRQIKEGRDEAAAFWEEQAVSSLFSAYLDAGDWQAAEKLLFDRTPLTGRQLIYDLPRVAQVAAREGAVDDAMRLWRMKANLDRRHLDGLVQLSATKAKEPLREMYAQMKKKDPLTFVPDLALRLLQ